MKWAIVTLTKSGAELGRKLSDKIPGSVLYTLPGRGDYLSEEIKGSLKEFTASVFNQYDIIIFIMATGIVVRTISGLINDKETDPGVLVMDEKGKFVISLLSGHLGGANMGAEYVAGLTGATAVITTATDVNGMVSPDMLAVKLGAVIDDMSICKTVTAVMVNGGRVALLPYNDMDIPHPYVSDAESADALVCITNRIAEMRKARSKGKPAVILVPRNIVIGAGCRKGCDPSALQGFIEEELNLLGIDRRAVGAVASIDIKTDEPAIRLAAELFIAEALFFTAESLIEVEHMFECSDFVRETTGAGSVAEPSAWLGSGCSGTMLLHKKKREGMTLAIAEKKLKREL